MELEEQKDKIRDGLCSFLQYDIDYVNDRKFYDELVDIGETTDEAAAKALYV